MKSVIQRKDELKEEEDTGSKMKRILDNDKSRCDEQDTASASSVEGSCSETDKMPLFKYSRMLGALPRAPKDDRVLKNALKTICTCSCMGKVVLQAETPSLAEGAVGASSSSTADQPDADYLQSLGRPQFVLCLGYQDGTVQMVEAQTGQPVISVDLLRVSESSSEKNSPIVDISMDSSGTILAAINEAGTCAIWELKYASSAGTAAQGGPTGASPSASAVTSETTSTTTAETNPFASFLNQFGGGGGGGGGSASVTNTSANAQTSSDPNSCEAKDSESHQPPALLTCAVSGTTRLSYARSSYAQPTCMVLDPAYKKRGERAVLVGFRDGRVILTKRDGIMLFRSRNDAILYQGVPSGSSKKDYRGAEAMAWRGSLVAWADATGLKLYDIEHMTRIAHVNRPTGARAALYPSIATIRPHLVFETSQNLLLAWGDCVMTMHVRETITAPTSSSQPDPTTLGGLAPPDHSGSQLIKKQYTVECSMAWELDCIACGVVPLDERCLMVLGLVPTDESEGPLPDIGTNDLEVQVISRATGTITYADILPVVRQVSSNFVTSLGGKQGKGAGFNTLQESSLSYSLLSSFAVPRMDDRYEIEEEGMDQDIQDFDFNIFAPQASPGSTKNPAQFKDFHMRWSLESVNYQAEETVEAAKEEQIQNDEGEMKDEANHEHAEEEATEQEHVEVGIPGDVVDTTIIEEEGEDEEDDDDEVELDKDDAASVDSDFYEFIVRPTMTAHDEEALASIAHINAMPPAMTVISASDIVIVRVRDVDDAIEYALSSGKVGLAMLRALRHNRELRRLDLNDVVNRYLSAVLRISPLDDNTKSASAERSNDLSIRRLKLAAEATPMLLGGNISQWQQWVGEFAQIPGALFVLRDYIPVRDPRLPQKVYQQVVSTLYQEAARMMAEADYVQDRLAAEEAVRRFLNTVVGFGPLQTLRAKINFLQYGESSKDDDDEKNRSSAVAQLDELENLLDRRLTQSAAGYLRLPTRTISAPLATAVPATSPTATSVISESLFDVPFFMQFLTALDTPKSRLLLETLAEVNLMMGNHEESLRGYLRIGMFHSKVSLEELEKLAIRAVNDGDGDAHDKSIINDEHGFVLAMVEFHHLHRCLLDPEFSELAGKNDAMVTPLIAMICLVGLEKMGNFLVEHCVPPPAESTFMTTDSLYSSGTESSLPRNGHETLPINFVAEQLTTSLPLLHWYLHQIFVRKPEMYVRFSTTSVPPRAVTDLHRIHLDLYIDYAVDKDSALSLIGTERYNLERKTTPLLSFLKEALPLGGIRPAEVRKTLEAQRSETASILTADDFPHSFAIELAYVIENYGNDSEEDARAVLDLYLKGARSVTLATSYAQRNSRHSTVLWNELIQFCLENSRMSSIEKSGDGGETGSLFGPLLESAALVGADLALLVTRIPQGMDVEGLRPRLVAAVGDYRLKLQMHESACRVGNDEKVNLLRDVTHRSRRGTRVTLDQLSSDACAKLEIAGRKAWPGAAPKGSSGEKKSSLSFRPNRYRMSINLPMR